MTVEAGLCNDSFFGGDTNIYIVPYEGLLSLEKSQRDETITHYKNLNFHRLIPVKDIIPGDFIINHNKRLSQITEKIQKKYTGIIASIRHIRSQSTLTLCGSHRILTKEKEVSKTGDNFWKLFPVELYKKIKVNNKSRQFENDILWEYVQNEQLGTVLTKDFQIGPFIADFYADEKKLIIEIDDEFSTKQSIHYRSLMDNFFKSKGFDILRYTQDEILYNLPNTLRHIKSVLMKRSKAEFKGKDWVRADSLEVGDMVYFSLNQSQIKIKEIEFEEVTMTLHGLKIDRPGSCITEVATTWCPALIQLS